MLMVCQERGQPLRVVEALLGNKVTASPAANQLIHRLSLYRLISTRRMPVGKLLPVSQNPLLDNGRHARCAQPLVELYL